ncbi:AI-2E family transporter [Phytohalomonas tamaricis]|uniref:AI-2E family transporter n=1 Tax=Phytohalomonas tamaricis TaxID=2081032 RepID=UPI000D0B49FA|nr:AI-2E family transporter [Phytohalomonas tamaricis]
MEDPEKKASHFPYHLVLTCASLVVIVAGLKLGTALFVPILLATFIAVLCARPVEWLHRRGLGVTWSVCCVLIVLGLALSLFTSLVISRLSEFSDEVPKLESELRHHYAGLLGWFNDIGIPINPDATSQLLDPTTLTQMMPMLLGGIGNVLSQSVIIFIMIIFLLFEILDFPNKLALAVQRPDASLKRFTQFSLTLQRYLIVKTIISLITGALVSLSCVLLKIEFAFLWGALAFFLNYIPNIGSILAAIPAVMLTLVMPDGGGVKALLLGGAYTAINFLLGNLIEPRVMGQTLGMSTLVAFLSLVVWGWIFGPVGMFLSVPLTMSLKIALDSHPDTRWLSIMIGPTQRKPKRS